LAFQNRLKKIVVAMAQVIPNAWHDPVTDVDFSFDESGRFIDSSGSGPGPGFSLSDPNLAQWLHAFVQQRLVSLGLEPFTLSDGSTVIYITPHAFDSPANLLVLVCGAGRIFPGVWSVGVCVYHGLRAGSVIPMVETALARSMSVVILNVNSAFFYWNKINHAKHVFERHIIPGNPGNVRVVAHSLGGLCILGVVREFTRWAIDHIRAIAFTDGVETQLSASGYQIRRWALAHAVNWVRSLAPTNTDLGDGPASLHRSAGTTDHALTTHAAFPYIWEFFEERGGEADAAEQFEGDENRQFVLPHCAVA
jgi:hypothetical protein